MIIFKLLGVVILAVVLVFVGSVIIVTFICCLWFLSCKIMIKFGWATEEEIIKMNEPF